MNNNEIVILDFTDCKYLSDFHFRIKKALDFPEYYGENLSALWDLLWSLCPPKKVFIRGANGLSEELRKYLDSVLCLFDRNTEWQKQYGYSFSYEIVD